MNHLYGVGGVMCAGLLFATGSYAEILGTEPGTSSHPKDNVPKEIQRSTLGEGSYPKGSSGPGTRSDELVGMEKEKAEPVTLDDLKKNVEKTHGGASAVAGTKPTNRPTAVLASISVRFAPVDVSIRISRTPAPACWPRL